MSITVFTRMQDKVSSLNFVLNMSGHFKFTYETPQWTAPIRIALNQKPSQTTACIPQSSSAICAPVGYYAALSGKSVPTFRDNLSALS